MRIAVFLVVLMVTGLSGAQTDVHIKVTTEGYAIIRIGFTELETSSTGQVAAYYEEFLNTLRNDIDLSGYFEIVKDLEKDLPHAIVEAAAKADRNDLSFDVALMDRASGESIFRRKYRSPVDGIREAAHTVADDIVFALTGRSGIANTQIAFVSGEKAKSHLYAVNIDGSRRIRLTDAPGIVMSPCWSPQGERIAYVSFEEGKSAVYVIDVSGHGKTRFASFEGMNATPSWAPDGKRMALTLSKDGNPEVYVFSLDGRMRKRITYYSGIDCSPTWAPNGLELAFTSDRAGSPQIFVADTEGLNVRRITSTGGYNTSPAWSPEGDLIAYVSRIDGRFQICTVDPFGITTSILTESGNNEDPEWSPDGMHIVFSSTVGGNSGIYIMNRDGNQRRRILEGFERPRNPAWSCPIRSGQLSSAGG